MNPKTLPLILCVAACLGCSHDLKVGASNSPKASHSHSKGNLVGTWTNDAGTGAQAQTVVFRKDGTATITGFSPQMKGLKVIAGADYKLKGDAYTMKPTSVHLELSGKADPKVEAAIEADNKKLSNPAAYKNAKVDTGTISWKDANHFTLTDKNGKVVHFERKA